MAISNHFNQFKLNKILSSVLKSTSELVYYKTLFSVILPHVRDFDKNSKCKKCFQTAILNPTRLVYIVTLFGLNRKKQHPDNELQFQHTPVVNIYYILCVHAYSFRSDMDFYMLSKGPSIFAWQCRGQQSTQERTKQIRKGVKLDSIRPQNPHHLCFTKLKGFHCQAKKAITYLTQRERQVL